MASSAPSSASASGSHKQPEPEREPEVDPVVQLCSEGLLQRLRPTLQSWQTRLEALNARQDKVLAELEGQRERLGQNVAARQRKEFVDGRETIEEMCEITRVYQRKLLSLTREMPALTLRSARLSQRAVAVMEEAQRRKVAEDRLVARMEDDKAD